MGQDRNKTGLIIGILLLVILVLVAVLAYVFLISPKISGYITQGQNQGADYVIYSIMQQAVTCQQVPLTFGNQTINMIAVKCLQQPQQAQQVPATEQ